MLRLGLLFFIAFLFAQPAHAEGRRLALVIGNDSYENVTPLEKARNDARAVADRLRALGFDVVAAEDVGRRAMARAVHELEGRIEPGDVVLMFYAGHGFALDGRNYLLPVDIPKPERGDEGVIRDEAFLADEVAGRFREKGASAAVLVLDACRFNPFEAAATRGVGTSRGLSIAKPAEGVFVLFSAGQNQAALDGMGPNDKDPNSVFSRNFIKELDKPGQSMITIAKAVQKEVRSLAKSVGAEQEPAYYDQVDGDIVLNPGRAVGDGGNVEVFKEGDSKTALLPPVKIKPVGKPGPVANFSRSNSGWTVAISLPEAAIQFGYRIGPGGAFVDTGTIEALDPRTGQKLPKTWFELPPDQGATTLFVTWRDPRGEEAGVFPIPFDPDQALRASLKSILRDTSTAWLAFGGDGKPLVYFTHLFSYRCAIKEAKYGVNDSAVTTLVKFPPCDPADPYSVGEDTSEMYKALPAKAKSVSLELTFYDGEKSGVKVFGVK